MSTSRISLTNVNLHYPLVAYATRSLLGMLGRAIGFLSGPDGETG